MRTFRVQIKVETIETFFLDAESEAEIDEFLEENGDWKPGDTEGLVDSIDEGEVSYEVLSESKIVCL